MKDNSIRVFWAKGISDGSSYKKQVLLPLIGAAVLIVMCALVPILFLAANSGVMTAGIKWILCLLLILFFAAGMACLQRTGTNFSRNALVFCLVDGTALYAIDARPAIGAGAARTRIKALITLIKSLASTAETLDRIADSAHLEEEIRTGKIAACASRVTEIRQLRHISGRRFAECDVITARGISRTDRYDISAHTDALFALLEERCPSGKWEAGRHTYTAQICASALLALVCLGVCVAGHPAVGMLPEAVYYPCLCALCVPVIALGIYIVKRRRGE